MCVLLRLGRRSSHAWKDRSPSRDRRPASKASTLMSSSRSGQWTPYPAPINVQWLRSLTVPALSLGNQSRGAETERPSSTSKVKVERVTVTERIVGTRSSRVEKVIPCAPQGLQLDFDDLLDVAKLSARETSIVGQVCHRIEPELRVGSISGDMDVSRLAPVAREKMGTVRASTEDGRHEGDLLLSLARPLSESLAPSPPRRGRLRGISRESSRSPRLRAGRPARGRRPRRSCRRRGCGRSRA